MNLQSIQDEIHAWSVKNFGEGQEDNSLLGVVEELGELCHAHIPAREHPPI